MDNQGKRKVATAFASAFAESLGEVLASATGVLWPLEVLSQPNTPTPKGTPINFRVSVDGALSGEYYVEFLRTPGCGAGVQDSQAAGREVHG